MLRKLTLKSSMKFGQYELLTVQNLIDLGKHRYLRWVYYNMSNIDFFDDILEEIGCINYKIEKPSTNKEIYEYIQKLNLMTYTKEQKEDSLKKAKKLYKIELKNKLKKQSRLLFSKSANRMANRWNYS